MPAPDTEPENYSIDDMLDRLRSRGEGGAAEGEAKLVTREDGTQVYKVRKRKRRSHQPKKEKEKIQKRFRIAQVVMAVTLVILLGLGFFASLVYLNSSAYRDQALAKIRTWTGAEPQITVLRVTPVSVGAESVALKWPETSMLDELKISGVSGDLEFTKLFSGIWKGAELHSQRGGTLVLRPPTGKGPAEPKTAGECPFQFRYRTDKLNVRMGDEKSPTFAVRDSQASLVILHPSGSTSNLQLEGGNLNLAGWGDFSLEFASLQFEPNGVSVGSIRLSPPGAGKGEIQILNPDDVPIDFNGETDLAMRMDHMPLSALLGPAFGSWLTTTVASPEENGDGTLMIRSGGGSAISCRIPFRAMASVESTAAELPMFEVLAQELSEPWYVRPRFDVEVKGEAVRGNGRTGVEKLILDARGRLSIAGKVSADAEGKLDGELEVGLPSSAVANGPPGMRNVFNRKGGGFSWAKVRISGTSRQPADDLAAQIKSSATTASPVDGGEKALEKTFDELITPSGGR